MYALHSNPHLLSLTLVIISGVTALVLLERTLIPTLRKRGDLYPALLAFSIILAKTVIPLVLLWNVLNLSPASLGWVTGGLFQAVWKGVILAALMTAFMFIYQHYSHRLFGTPYTSTGAHLLNRERAACPGFSCAFCSFMIRIQRYMQAVFGSGHDNRTRSSRLLLHIPGFKLSGTKGDDQWETD